MSNNRDPNKPSKSENQTYSSECFVCTTPWCLSLTQNAIIRLVYDDRSNVPLFSFSVFVGQS